MKFQRYAFQNRETRRKEEGIREVPFPMVFSMVVLSIVCLLLSMIAIPQVRDMILTPAVNILVHPDLYSTPILGM